MQSTVPRSGFSRSKVRSAVGWASLSTALSQVLLALVAFSVAAAVAPRQYALWGLGAILFNARILGTLGLEQALIYFSREGRERDYLDTAFVGTLFLGVALGLAGFLAAPLIADHLGRGFLRGDVILALRIMSVSLVFATLKSIPSALLERRLAFRRRAVPDVGSTLFYAALTVVLLAAGAGIWSLIIARAAYSVVRTTAFWLVAPARPNLPPHPLLAVLKPMLAYGILLNAAGLLSFLTQNIDTLSVARVAGAAATGAYVLAFTVASFVPTFLSYSLLRVAFPLLVTAGTVAGRIQNALASVLHATAVVIFPTTAAVAVIAPSLLVSVFGEQWRSVEPLLRILAFYGLFRTLIEVLTTFLNATGRPAHPVLVQTTVLAVALVLLWPLSAHGAPGVALAFTIGQGVGMILSLFLAREAWSMAVPRRLARPLAATVIASLGALAASAVAPPGTGPWVSAVAFAVVLAISMLVLDPWVRDAARSARRSAISWEAAR